MSGFIPSDRVRLPYFHLRPEQGNCLYRIKYPNLCSNSENFNV